KNLRYTRDHEWARREAKTGVVGVTGHAPESLGDVVYVELPELGEKITAGKPFGVIESTKAVSELFAPISGTVVKLNDALTDAPQTINQDPYKAGWIIEIEPSDAKQWDALMDAVRYKEMLKIST